ncbi:hypothetical protein [Streptomyces sp. NPDC058398]|uniref:hypothetical protein n=1 Tax=Streptomyces sp. NPDC058398 TaxID=3346479 RepID=UPI003659EF88
MSATVTLEGEFALTDEVLSVDSGYEDIAEGTSVTVYGAKGDVVATGSLGDSKPSDSGLACTFKIAVEDVPKGEKFYKVEVSHRGTVQLSAEEAKAGELAASLGWPETPGPRSSRTGAFVLRWVCGRC